MITKTIDESKVSVIPKDADDLLSLRRIIKTGDKIVGDTTRVIKQDRDFARPDRGQRIRIRICLQVEKISLDKVVDRLRVSGTISESKSEEIPHGSHHSMILKTNDPFTIIKKKWDNMEKKLLQTRDKTGFVLISIDKSDCAIARLDGTHLDIMPNIYSGSSGKRYKSSFNIEKFFHEINGALGSTVKNDDCVIIFGPGETKKKFANFIKDSHTKTPTVVEGIDSSGEDGIYTFTKSDIMKEVMAESKIAKIANIIDDIMMMANKQSRKFTMGFDETYKADQFGAIDSLVFSDKVFEVKDEADVIEFLNNTESRGSQIFGVDSSTDLGLRVAGLGGIISTLRFAVDA